MRQKTEFLVAPDLEPGRNSDEWLCVGFIHFFAAESGLIFAVVAGIPGGCNRNLEFFAA